MKASFSLKSQEEIGQGQSLQSGYKQQHWQYVGITILISITVFFICAGVSSEASLHTFSSLLQFQQSPRTVVSTSIYFTPLLWTAHCKSDLTKPPARLCTNILSHQHMLVKSGCNFSTSSCWDKRQSHAWEKIK